MHLKPPAADEVTALRTNHLTSTVLQVQQDTAPAATHTLFQNHLPAIAKGAKGEVITSTSPSTGKPQQPQPPLSPSITKQSMPSRKQPNTDQVPAGCTHPDELCGLHIVGHCCPSCSCSCGQSHIEPGIIKLTVIVQDLHTTQQTGCGLRKRVRNAQATRFGVTHQESASCRGP